MTNAGQRGMLGISAGLCVTTTRALTFDYIPEPVNDPQKAELTLELGRQAIPGHDPRKPPTGQPGDGYVLVGALVGVTAGAALGVAVGLATATYIAIVGGVVAGGVIGAVLGNHIKRRITKRSRAERQT